MRPFEIFITCISWKNGEKNRPVLVLLLGDEVVSVYPITTQYENKSEAIRIKYFKINDWSQAGLDKQSYIDTGILLNLPISVIKNKKPIGKLTIEDKNRLLAFLKTGNV
jgi:hypothetical protein